MNKQKLLELLHILFVLLVCISLIIAGLTKSFLISAISLIPALIIMIIVGVITNKQ